jgi:splicing factor 3B subunit 2
LPISKFYFIINEGWGKPPIDDYGRPLYGGNPFDPPGSSFKNVSNEPTNLVTSDGKTVSKVEWGAMPMGYLEEKIDDESSEDEMEESSSDDDSEGDLNEVIDDGMESVMPAIPSVVVPSSLRKDTGGEETPIPTTGPPKQLYQIIEQKKSIADPSAVFASEVAYVVPASIQSAASVPEGAESVLSKVLPANKSTRRSRKDDDDNDDLGKNFKF